MVTPSIGGPMVARWWPDGGTTPEGSEIEHLSSLGLSQVIFEPTNFEPNKDRSLSIL